MVFWRRSRQEKELERVYYELALRSEVFDCTASEARSIARKVIELGKQRAEDEKGLPERFGDFIIKRQDSDPQARAILEARRLEGVRDEDFLWWWNQTPLERGVLLAFDDLMRIALWEEIRVADDLSEDEAATELRRRVVNYGNPDDGAPETGDDKLIPFELKDRVNRWLEGEAQNAEEFSAKLARASSMNALIRAELRAGRL